MRCILAFLLSLAACGDDGVVGEPGSSAQKRYDAEKARERAEVALTKTAEPKLAVPRTLQLGDGLMVDVLEDGSGALLASGDEALVHYSISYVPKSEAPKTATEATVDAATISAKDSSKDPGGSTASPSDEVPKNEAVKVDAETIAKPAADEPKPDEKVPEVTTSTASSESKPESAAAELTTASETLPPKSDEPAVTTGVPSITSPAESAPSQPLEPIVVATTRTSAAPVALRLDDSKALKGLVRGLIGLRVGTRARITVPATLAYGAAGLASSGIPPDTQLFVDVDVRGVRR